MKSLAELAALREQMKASMNMRQEDRDKIRVVVGMATCGIAAGARPVLGAFVDEIAKRNLNNITVTQTGCIGICKYEPVVEVYVPGQEKVTYVKMTAEKAMRVVAEHLVNNQVVSEVREHFGELTYETIIQRNIRLGEAPSHGKPIMLYDASAVGATNYLNLAREFLKRNKTKRE